MEKRRLLEGLGPSATSVLTLPSSCKVANYVFDELLALEHALSAQIKAIGERCVSLWGKQ